MKSLSALLVWQAAHLSNGALLSKRSSAPRIVRSHTAFLAKKENAKVAGVQPWLYNPPPATVPRGKPLEIPGDPLVLPPVDKMWGMQPTVSPVTIEPPEKEGETGLQQTVPPQSLEGWYATIPPDMIEKGLVDPHVAYYARCLGGPGPCPYTVPPAVISHWERVQTGKCYASGPLLRGTTQLEVSATVGFAVGDTIMIGNREVKMITGFGSIIINTPLMFDYPPGTPIQVVPRAPMPMPMPMPGPAPGPAPLMPAFPPWSNFRPMGMWTPTMPLRPVPAPAPAPLLAIAPVAAPVPAPAPAPGPVPFVR